MRTGIILVVVVCLAIPFAALAQKVGGGDITFSPKNASPVTFSHETHVKGKGIKCTGCFRSARLSLTSLRVVSLIMISPRG